MPLSHVAGVILIIKLTGHAAPISLFQASLRGPLSFFTLLQVDKQLSSGESSGQRGGDSRFIARMPQPPRRLAQAAARRHVSSRLMVYRTIDDRRNSSRHLQ